MWRQRRYKLPVPDFFHHYFKDLKEAIMINKNVHFFLAAIMLVSFTANVSCMGARESASSSTRGLYLADQGLVVPAEEIYTDAYIASIDYKYPQPASEMGVYLYNSTGQMDVRGQEGILHIGIKGRSQSYESLPPMNLAFVIDTASSMNEQDKIAWVKESVEIFMKKVRDVDYLSLVSFNDTARVIFESTRMDSPAKKQNFLAAVKGLSPQGGTNLEAGLKAGYEQLLANFREGSVNRLFLFSDGTEFSQRLTGAGAQSGDIRVSLLWNNRNDLDIHVVTPRGEEIFYGRTKDSTGGFLDVDMNVNGETTKPVENIFWPIGKAPQGNYRVYVQNFSFNERDRSPTTFQVEVKNGNAYYQYEGEVTGAGRNSNTEVCVFEYKVESGLRREKALVYQLAETYREMGITTSTLGVGVGFDLELMMTLADEGGGSSRFLGSREEMVKTFDTEFERMAVLAARDLEMDLEFMSGVEILETWGYKNKVDGNKAHYQLSGLHLGDYETILVRYRLPPIQTQGERTLARFKVNTKDVSGKPLPPQEYTLNVNFSGTVVDGISTGKLLYSGTMMHFAENLKAIGNLYYENLNNQNHLARFDECLKKTLASQEELENAKLRLDDKEAFNKELEILSRYAELFRKQIVAAGGTVPDTTSPPVSPQRPTANMDILHNRVASLFTEISLSFPAGEIPTAAISSFALRDGSEPPLVTYLNQSAITALASNPRLRLLERERLDAIRLEQRLQTGELLDADVAIRLGRLMGARYIITGQIIPMSAQVIVFGRVINVETGEIMSAAQIFLDRDILGELI
jgi:Ca-activated chloride channel family protein